MSESNLGSRESTLRSVAQEFCKAFIYGGTAPPQLLSQYFSASPQILEHGPEWITERLPFAGQQFEGRRSASSPGNEKTCDDYFDLLGATLSLQPHENSLPEQDCYVVDSQTKYGGAAQPGAVVVRAHARLGCAHNDSTWEEHFVFILSQFDEEGKIGKLEIWADNLSAWVAVGPKK